MENWKAIPGYEGIYDASDIGRIRSAPGKTTSSARFSRRVWKSRILSQKDHNVRGDFAVTLWKDGKPKTFLVARLVAMAWCDGFSEELTVNHIDGNFRNNHADNLEWVAREVNIKKGFETGLYDSIQKRVILERNGEKFEFPSMKKASDFLGRSHSYVSECAKCSRVVRASDGAVFQLLPF